MIKFFRQIRKSLLLQNPTSAKATAGAKTGKPALPTSGRKSAGRYFKYAIGEIVLVVIGILIALSINNWNEQNKSKLVEIKILSELKNDLNSNYHEVSGIRNVTILAQKKTDSLIEVINHKNFDMNIHLTLLYGMNSGQYGIFNNSNTTYKFIESNGFKTLSNDSLRLSISKMYTQRFSNITFRQAAFKKFVEEAIWPYVSTNFYLGEYNKPIPVNLSPFSDLKFMNLLSKKAILLEASISTTGRCLKELERLVQEVEKEIVRLKG